MRTKKAVAYSQVALMLFLNVAPLVHANPSGEEVVAGSAGFDRAGSTLTITTSDRVIINWQDFSIGGGELTKFIQPSVSSSALNRVVSGNPSQIMGTLQANGQIFLINPNGILVGNGAVINTGGFTASTLDLNNSEFMSGGDLNFTGNSSAKVENQGRINAIGGDIYLIARHVENSGELNAPDGTVGLAAGTEVLLSQAGEEKIFVKPSVGENSASGTGILNSGTIQAARAELKAHGNIYALAINNTGVIRANGVVSKNGRVFLTAKGGDIKSSGVISAKNADQSGGKITISGGHNTSKPSTVLVSGKLEATGTKGGEIQVLGDQVGLVENATANASGDKGGGIILIGGDFQGNGSVQNAQKTFVAGSVSINANSGSGGDGGKVIVWADDWTRYYGSISAQGDNGGFVEVSGKNNLAFDGAVNVAGTTGVAGTVLLDPRDGTFQAAAGTGDGFFPTVDFADGGTGIDFTFGEAALEAITGNVVVQASRHMIFSNGLVLNFNNQTAGERVVFQADGNVTFNDGAQIITQGADIWVQSDSNADGAGTLTMGQNSQILSNGGQITLIADNFALNTSATPSLVNAGASGVGINLARSRSSVGLSTTVLSNAEIGRLQTASGTLTLGQATTAGTDGLGTGAVTITNDSITIAQDVTITAANAAAVRFIANNGIAIANNQDVTTSDATTFNADADANGTGTFSTSGNTDVTVNSGLMTINAADAILSPTGNFTANGGIVLQPSTVAGTIAINDATGDFNLSTVELSRLASTGTVAIGRAGGTGAVNIGSLGAINLSGEAYHLTMRGGSVSFNGNPVTLANNKTMTLNAGAISSTSAATDILIGGGSGNVVINAASAGNVDIDTQVSRVTATSVLGNLTVDNTGNLNIGASTVTGTASFSSTGNISQSGVINADTLALNATGTINLDTQANIINTLGAVTSGNTFELTDASGGLVLNGPVNSGNRVEIRTLGGAMTVNGDITAVDRIALRGVGISQAAGTALTSTGGGQINLSGLDGVVNLLGLLSTTSAASNAIFIHDTGALALGNIVALNGTLQLGAGSGGDRIAGATTQNAGTTINVNNLTVSSASSVALNNAGNLFGSIGSIRRGGTFSLTDSAGGLTINGPINTGSLGNDVTILTAGGDLVLNGIISTTGAGNDVTLVTNQNFINNAGAAAITTSGGGRFLIYSTDPALNSIGGLAFAFQQFSTVYPTPPLPGNVGNGFLFSLTPGGPSGGGATAGTTLLAQFSTTEDRYYRGPYTPPNGNYGIYYDGSSLNAAPPNLATDNGLDAAPPRGLSGPPAKKKTPKNLTTDSSFGAFASQVAP